MQENLQLRIVVLSYTIERTLWMIVLLDLVEHLQVLGAGGEVAGVGEGRNRLTCTTGRKLWLLVLLGLVKCLHLPELGTV